MLVCPRCSGDCEFRRRRHERPPSAVEGEAMGDDVVCPEGQCPLPVQGQRGEGIPVAPTRSPMSIYNYTAFVTLQLHRFSSEKCYRMPV